MLFKSTSEKGQNYYIVLTDKKAGWDKIIGRRKTTLEEINNQANWIWSLFNRKERRRYRVLVQGEVKDWRRAFDSERYIDARLIKLIG